MVSSIYTHYLDDVVFIAVGEVAIKREITGQVIFTQEIGPVVRVVTAIYH